MSSTAFAGSWTSLPTPLTPWILDVINSMGYSQMTPVQASTIPLLLKHKDVVVEAVTGSGKTLAFVIPVLERLGRRESRYRRNEIAALIISPTRELATQIHSVLSFFLSAQPQRGRDSELTSSDTEDSSYPEPLLLVSSDTSSPADDLKRFVVTGADIVIGTPGRVEEFLLRKGRGAVSVRELDILVLDEADRLLDLGFHASLTKILSYLPKQRRTGLFSATMTDSLSELVRVGLRNPARVLVKVQTKRAFRSESGKKEVLELVEEQRIPASLQNFFIRCRSSEKLIQLSRIISQEISQNKSSQFIVYFATCACVDYFYKILPSVFPFTSSLFSLHGNLPPAARTRTLSTFSSAHSDPSSPSIMLATDVAARGLDLPHVDVVIQFDAPSDPKAFSHRCGRTARAGRSGRAWILLAGRETEYVDFMSVRKIPIKEQPYIHRGRGADDSVDAEVDMFLSKIRAKVLTDRALHDQAAKAFVSFVRAYSKHEATYIFRLKDLDLIGVARSFGLLRLPKMPELKDADRSLWENAEVDWDSYAYADKVREAKRLSVKDTLQKEQPAKKLSRAEQRKINSPWSRKASKKEERDKRKEKRDRKKKWTKAQATSEPTQSEKNVKRSHSESDVGDWEQMVKEERMAKKLKRGQISQETFDAAFGEL